MSTVTRPKMTTARLRVLREMAMRGTVAAPSLNYEPRKHADALLTDGYLSQWLRRDGQPVFEVTARGRAALAAAEKGDRR